MTETVDLTTARLIAVVDNEPDQAKLRFLDDWKPLAAREEEA